MMETNTHTAFTLHGTDTDTLNTIWAELLTEYKYYDSHDEGIMEVVKTLVNNDKYSRINKSATEFIYVKSATEVVTIVVHK